MKTFWKYVGKTLANVAKYAGQGALWASQHPEVIGTVATIAGHPEVAAVVTKITPVIKPVGSAIEQKLDK